VGNCVDVSGGQSGSFSTTDAHCFRTQDNVYGWGASNFAGRSISVTINGSGTAVTTVGGSLPAKAANDYYYFQSTAGDFPWASVYWW
jgi:hypothetical protein